MLNPCRLCDAKCCKDHVITVTSFDVLRIIGKTGKKPSEFTELRTANLLNSDNDTIIECYKNKLRYEYVLALKSHPCYFLKDNLCTIHEFAPLGCRVYPHNDRGRVGARALCPTIAKLLFMIKKPDIMVGEYLRYFNEYKRIVAKWNKKHGTKEDCLEFLLEESKTSDI
ncbi:YkgJ family cysteine cluster protein [Candidatus Micrarchaeota archaeon]|nr:YkgJ family cysteine cluster protein [Candidatus Micrarchaeota archaeon]